MIKLCIKFIKIMHKSKIYEYFIIFLKNYAKMLAIFFYRVYDVAINKKNKKGDLKNEKNYYYVTCSCTCGK